jgi:hypothetical protein
VADDSGPLSPIDRDYVIRTLAGEEGNPAGWTAVANVIKNRLEAGNWGNTARSVVLSPGQFSDWNKVTGFAGGAGANTGPDLQPGSSRYNQIGKVVDDVFSGQGDDPTKGALNYYAPGGMPGGRPPSWAAEMKNPVTIGAQVYGTAGSTTPTRPARPATPTPALTPPGAMGLNQPARPYTPTPVQAPGPIDPSIIAHGGTSPPIPDIPGTTINSNPIASLGGKIGDLAGNLQKDLGKSDDDKAQPKPDIKPDIPPAPGARNISPLLGGPGGIGQGQVSPVFAQRMAGLNQPMTWGSAPPGQNPWTGYGIQTQPSVYGTSLMSNLQMLNDPTWMDQMAGGGSYG